MNEFEKMVFVVGFGGSLIMICSLFAYNSLKGMIKDALAERQTENWEYKYREECYKTRDLTIEIAREQSRAKSIITAFRSDKDVLERENARLQADIRQLVDALSGGRRRILVSANRPPSRPQRPQENPQPLI